MWLQKTLFFVIISSAFAFISNPFPTGILENFLQSLHKNPKSEVFTPGHECKRKCQPGDSKICYFEFVLELYPVLSSACKLCSNGEFADCFLPQCVTGNGRERTFMSINRQLPGPPVEVCKFDKIVVDVVNEIEGSSATIHWHGYAQDHSPFMDGVPWITQCPISHGQTFRYEFKAVQAGTFFYHSHAGHQKANGVQGAFIIRENENQKLYDFDLSEHVMVLADWMEEMTENYYPGDRNDSTLPHHLLINGRGRYVDKLTYETLNTPLSVFHVDKGKRYKFRLIGANSNICPMMFQIESHNFTVIAADSVDVKPFRADKLHLTAGERFDLVVEADQKERDYFWIKISAGSPCATGEVEEFAVLMYHQRGIKNEERLKMMNIKEKNPKDDRFLSTVELNSPASPDWPITLLESYKTDKDLVESHPKKTFFLSIGTPPILTGEIFTEEKFHKFIVTQHPSAVAAVARINKIVFVFPKVPLLSQLSEIDEKIFCNETNPATDDCLDNGVCYCVHRIMAPEHAVIELVVFSTGDPVAHPFHLHGHQFAVVETGWFSETFNDTELKNNPSKALLDRNPVYKDTVIIPKNGFVRMRVRTQSATFLFFHCHYDFHLQVGMAGVLQVGEFKSMPKPPKNFPQCRDYTPKLN